MIAYTTCCIEHQGIPGIFGLAIFTPQLKRERERERAGVKGSQRRRYIPEFRQAGCWTFTGRLMHMQRLDTPTMTLPVEVLFICGSQEKRIRSLKKHTPPELRCRRSSPNLHTSVSAESLVLLCLVPARQCILNQLPPGDSFPSPIALILLFHKARILQIHSCQSRSPASMSTACRQRPIGHSVSIQ